jgi:hypothetical protein
MYCGYFLLCRLANDSLAHFHYKMRTAHISAKNWPVVTGNSTPFIATLAATKACIMTGVTERFYAIEFPFM